MSTKIAVTNPLRNPSVPRKLLKPQEAARYLGVSLRWLETNPEIPRSNLAPPSSRRGMWRYSVADLDAFVASRRIDRHGGGQS